MYSQHQDEPTLKNQESVESVAIQVASNGLSGLFFAAHIGTNSAMLSWLDSEEGAEAASLISSTQAVAYALPVGMVIAAILQMGTEFGKKNYQNVGDIISFASIQTVAMGTILGSAFIGLGELYHKLYPSNSGELARDFFYGNAFSTIPLLYLFLAPQLMYFHGDVWAPALSMFEVFAISTLASSVLGFMLDKGAFGIGLGGLIGASTAALTIKGWTLNKEYKPYHMHQCWIDNAKTWFTEQKNKGCPLMLERTNEWFSIFLLTLIVSHYNDNQLAALNPSLSYLMILGVAQQGVAQGVGAMLANNKGAIDTAITEENTEIVYQEHLKTMKVAVGSNLIGLGISAASFAALSIGRATFVKPFIGEETDDNLVELSENLLMITFAGVVCDSFRIIGQGVLRGWNDILWPTTISAFCLTAGTLAGWGLSEMTHLNLVETMVAFRAVGILLSGAAIAKRQYDFIMQDRQKLEQKFPSFKGTWPKNPYTLFRNQKYNEPSLQLSEDSDLNAPLNPNDGLTSGV